MWIDHPLNRSDSWVGIYLEIEPSLRARRIKERWAWDPSILAPDHLGKRKWTGQAFKINADHAIFVHVPDHEITSICDTFQTYVAPLCIAG